MKVSHILLAILVAFIWASGYLVQKQLVGYIPPYLAISLEALLIAAFIIPFSPKPIIPLIDNIILSAVWGVFTYGSILAAAKMGINVNIAVVIGKLNIVFAIILSAIICKEKLNLKATAGIVVSFLGVLMLLNTPNVLEKPLAFLFMIIFSFSWGVYNVYVKILNIRYKKTFNPTVLVAWVALFAAPQTLLISFITEKWNTVVFNINSIMCLFYLAFAGTLGSLAIWFFLIQKNKIYKVAPFGLLTPIIGVILAYIFLGEIIAINHILSLIFVIIGIILVLNEENAERFNVKIYHKPNEEKV